MSYTPGPWEVIEVKGSYKIPFVVAAGEKRVATCTGDQLNPEGTSIGEARANASLIAASPEMYDELASVNALITQWRHSGVAPLAMLANANDSIDTLLDRIRGEA